MSIEHFSTYETASGNIRQWGTCGIGEGALVELEPGQAAVWGQGGPWTPRTHYVAAGVPVAYTAPQAAAKAERPSRRHLWSNTTMAWVDQRGLAEVKQDKWAAIKAEGLRRDRLPITVATKQFEADDATRTAMFQKMQIAREAIADGLTFSVDWPLDDDTVVTLNANQLKAVVRAIDARSESLKATARTLRAQIVAAANVAAVEAVAWP